MLVYTFDNTIDGILSAVFDAYFRHQQPDMLVGEGAQLPLFCEEVWQVVTTEEKATRVWTGLEKRLPREALHLIMVSWQSEEKDLPTPLFHYIYKVFGAKGIERNFSDPDVLHVTNTARRVMHEQLRMKQFIRFQKAKDGTYLAVVSPDHNVLPLITSHFQDRFNRLTSYHLKKIGVVMKKAKYFITCGELTSSFSQPIVGINELHPERLRPLLISKTQQKRAAAEQQLTLDFEDE